MMDTIDRCAACFDLAWRAAAIANNEVISAASQGPDYPSQDGDSASWDILAIAETLRAHGHSEYRLLHGLAALLPASLYSEQGRTLITETRDEVRVALGSPILLPHPPPPEERAGDDELSVA